MPSRTKPAPTDIEELDEIDLDAELGDGELDELLELEHGDDEADEELEEVEAETPNYGERNNLLFGRRDELRDRLAEMDANPRQTRTARGRKELAVAKREFEDVKRELVEANLGLVRKYVGKFTSHTSQEDSEDFHSAGVLGLMRAIDRYDRNRGTFGQWAHRQIKNEVLQAVRHADHANLNRGDFERRPIVKSTIERLTEKLGREPTDEEVAEAAEVNVAQVGRIRHAPHIGSLSARVGEEDSDSTLADLVQDDLPDPAAQVIASMTVANLETHGLKVLDQRELFVLVHRFGCHGEPELRLADIGRLLGLSREAARQIDASAKSKLGHPVVLRKLMGSAS